MKRTKARRLRAKRHSKKRLARVRAVKRAEAAIMALSSSTATTSLPEVEMTLSTSGLQPKNFYMSEMDWNDSYSEHSVIRELVLEPATADLPSMSSSVHRVGYQRVADDDRRE